MAAQIVAVVPKRALDFATVAVGATQEVILADRIPLLPWRELTLKVRVHSHTLSGSNTVSVNIYPQSWTIEEPATQFVASSNAGQAQIGASVASPGLVSTAITMNGASSPIPAMARVTALASRAGAGAMQAVLSVEIATKDV